MAPRIIKCSKLGIEAPGLEAPPFPGELGQEIYEKVSAQAWQAWSGDMMIKIINEYRLNLAESDQYDILIQQMRSFLNLGGGSSVLEVENAERGRSK